MKYLPAGTIKRIHVDRQILAQNRKTGGDEPAWTIQTSKGSFKSRQVYMNGRCRAIQGAKPLSCGARMYIETRSMVHYE